MTQDFRFALRQLLKTPGFTTVAVLTLALAIGVNSAIFALINGVLLKPVVPVRPAEVVNVFTARQNASHDYRQFSHNEYRELRENGGAVFVDVAALEFAVAGIRRERVDRAGYLAAARHSFAARFGFRRFRNYARPVGPKKLHLQSSGADAFRPDDRRGKSPFASAGATDKCDSTGRQRRFPRATN